MGATPLQVFRTTLPPMKIVASSIRKISMMFVTSLSLNTASTRKKEEKEKRVKLEIKSKRNDRWISSHMDPLMTVWRANMNVQLTINLGKVIGYMTKYVTKMEVSLTKGAQAMMARVLTKSIADGHCAQHALRKGMGKMLGERTIPMQEKCHLIMSLPTVTCSHEFVKINLINDVNRLLLSSNDNAPATEHNNDESGGAEQQVAPSLTKLSLLDAYRICTEGSNWLSVQEFEAVEDSLQSMSFRTFAVDFKVGERGAHRNKIK